MKIGVISDIHENTHNLLFALKIIQEHKAERILFLGDFMNTGIAITLSQSSVPVFAIWGNNDGEKVDITKTSLAPNSNLSVSSNVYDFLEIAGRKIFISHYPDLAKPMAKSGDFDAVFYGHNHIKRKDRIGTCLVLNPGEISAHKTGESSLAIYDTTTNDAEIITINDSITLRTDTVVQHSKGAGMKLIPTKGHEF